MLAGKNITLRPLKFEDAPQTLELRYDIKANKAIMGYPFPVNLENEKNWIGGLYPQGERKTIFLAIEENETKKFAGYLSVKNINCINGTADFGIILIEESRGKGHAKEAMKLFFNYLYREIHLRKLTLYVLEGNAPAIDAYQKVGFSQEGLLKEHAWQDGQYKNIIVMSIFLKNLAE
ncbi:MAG: GNAT family N-acetyltransferase [Acidobacteria bacterium]|jgi:RimJ/RimL family protein N-acetyltransferase|nr:GNAT family N-acetyltransferase [Acidobacteriota bacterium]